LEHKFPVQIKQVICSITSKFCCQVQSQREREATIVNWTSK